MHPTSNYASEQSLYRRLLNIPYIPLWMLRDDALVAMMEKASEVFVLDDEQPLSPATKAKSDRAFTVTRDRNGVTHSQAERRKAVLAFVAAAKEDLGEEVAVTVAGPLPELSGATIFLLLPETALVRTAVTPA
jgi:hypothetical protein